MKEQIPFSLELDDGMVIGPAQYRLQDLACISERAVRVVTHRVDDVVRIAGGPGEIVFPLVLVHPCGFEKTPVLVAGKQRLAFFIKDLQVARCFGVLQHVFAQARNFRAERRLVIGRVGIGRAIGSLRPALQLATPDATEVHVMRAIVILEYRRVHAEAAADRLCFRLERACR